MPLRFGGDGAWFAAAIAIALLAYPAPTFAEPPDPGRSAAQTSHFVELKRLEHATLIQPAAQELRRLDRLRAARRGPVRTPRVPGVRLRQEAPRERAEAGLGASGVAAPLSRVLGAPVNVLVNDRTGDRAVGSMQSEATAAAWGHYALVAWNDGESNYTGGDAVGFGWSTDGGATWTDGGSPPHGSAIDRWISDPVVVVNERTGDFYLAAMALTTLERNGIGVVAGRFGPAGFAFDPPELAREAGRDTLPDKPWLAADSLTGDLYLSYTSFFYRGVSRLGDQIEFQRRTAEGGAWSPRVKLSPAAEDGLVQGSRPAVGPAGEVVVAWTAVDTTDAAGGLDFMRVRRSRDRGASFAPEVTAAGHFTNFGSGAPGFNRGFGFSMPGLAVDRSAGPYRGRVYLVWQESVDFFHDPLGGGGVQVEQDPSDVPATATAATIGQTLRGAIDATADVDHFRFHGARGQTVVLYLDSLATGLDLSLRILCGDGETRLAYSAPIEIRPRLAVFTLPATGDYYLRIAPNGLGTGGYRVLTGFHRPGAERARDHRDVFACASDDAVHWTTPTRVNDDDGAYDDWLPEIAVDAAGRVYAAWYDWRDAGEARCAGASLVYHARSGDGGVTWTPLGPLADALSDWSRVSSNLAPNQGDYIALCAGSESLMAAWADGRNGTPDIYLARRPLAGEPPPAGLPPGPRLERARPNPSRGELTVSFAVADVTAAVLELLDLSGRRWRRVVIDHPQRGSNQADLSEGPRLPPGVYVVRLAQGGRSQAKKWIVVR